MKSLFKKSIRTACRLIMGADIMMLESLTSQRKPFRFSTTTFTFETECKHQGGGFHSVRTSHDGMVPPHMIKGQSGSTGRQAFL